MFTNELRAVLKNLVVEESELQVRYLNVSVLLSHV